MIFNGLTQEYLQLETISKDNCHVLKSTKESSLNLLWMLDDETELIVDHQAYNLKTNDVICLTEFHQVGVNRIGKAKLVRFNRQFYCILDHDSEVGCKGLLFFGAAQLPLFNIPKQDLEIFETLWRMFELEMRSTDKLQLEMLQMMLKRLLILCTRLYKEQSHLDSKDGVKADLVREFNFLVEQHFKTKHTVKDYADLLNRSPKTISNTFSNIGSKSPLKLIQERRMLEARRLLRYTDSPVSEIAYEIGFDDVQSFSRFFRRQEGFSPSDFKEKLI